jgi:DNA-binding NtrC family response regulator
MTPEAVSQGSQALSILLSNPFRPDVQQRKRVAQREGSLPAGGARLKDWKAWFLQRIPTVLTEQDPETVALAVFVGVGAEATPDEISRRIKQAQAWFSGRVESSVPELACRSLHVRATLERLVGNSPQMREVRVQGWAAAFGENLQHALGLASLLQETPVLLLGETGTGKELLAQSLCAAAPGRWDDKNGWKPGPNDSLNLAALPEDLTLSALFGHKKGAFSGAGQNRTGVLERCHGGAVFLDEVADLPPSAQAALLRALQEGRVRRLGDDEDAPAALRLISATHHDLLARAHEGKFRLDLYHRLSSVILELPPLRERLDDVELLAESIITARVSPELRPVLKERFATFLDNSGRDYEWPGNVRELVAVVHALCLGLQPRLASARAPVHGAIPSQLLERCYTLEEAKRWYARHVREGCTTMAEAAQRLGIDRGTLRAMLPSER